MNIRKATKQDIEILLKFGKQLHLVEKEYEPLLEYSEEEAHKRYLKQLENKLALFLIAESDSHLPIAYLYAHAEKTNSNIDVLECDLEVIYISPEFRNKGISKQLLS